MKLSHILKELTFEKIIEPIGFDPDMEVKSIHFDTRDVENGGLFVAVKGLIADGHDYIEAAVEKGASVIISEKEIKKEILKDSVLILSKNTRKSLSKVSDLFYGKPSEKLCLIGITGTNGKTTVTYMIESILDRAGIKSGVIGTVNYRYNGKIFSNPRTTPESCDLQRILSEMKDDGVTHVIMEVSSHALDLNRVDDARFDIAVFTNLSQDHLDFHSDMKSYFQSKKRLFNDLLQKSGKKTGAVINCIFDEGKEIYKELSEYDTFLISTGTTDGLKLYAESVEMNIDGIVCKIRSEKGDFDLKTSAVGKHNLENLLGAAGVGIMLNLPLKDIQKGMEEFVVPGRLQRVKEGRNVFVDYAHTPDALENVLLTLKNLCEGRLITIFGCGGDRDKSKRPIMGKIACKYSDISLITSDNPRTEDPDAIIADIVEGVKESDARKIDIDIDEINSLDKVYYIDADRKRSIEKGIKVSKQTDIVLIAGKGHENYQEIGKERFPFDDSIIAKDLM
ncbi:MAG: UDP-N-acetylmuramoyl-L-alanyl-D-glutamate--2,6-diaminopimelate ligase [Desulfobacterales bacterium]|nr:UDP-N-acetylmuramoyl-L-alanyl-D-glutamate--2,6-diaminopimelate ligase [Desulfobacterales bacterium]